MKGCSLDMIQPHTAIQATGTYSASGQGTISWLCVHEKYVSHGPDLCNLPVHLQSPGGLLPKICGKASKKQIKDILIQYDQTILVSNIPGCRPQNVEILVPIIITRNPTKKPIMRIRFTFIINNGCEI